MHDLALPSSGRASGAGDACLFGLSLCSGAGGLDLGLAIAIPGYRAVGHVERETFAAATLVARMEDASLDQAVVWDDVATFDGRPWRGAVDIVTAGFMQSTGLCRVGRQVSVTAPFSIVSLRIISGAGGGFQHGDQLVRGLEAAFLEDGRA